MVDWHRSDIARLLIVSALACILTACSTMNRDTVEAPHVTRLARPVDQDQATAIAAGYVYGQGQAATVDLSRTRVFDGGDEWHVELPLAKPRGIPNVRIVAVGKDTGVPRWYPVE